VTSFLTAMALLAGALNAGAQAKEPQRPEPSPDRSGWPTYHGGFSLDGVAATAVPDRPVRLWRFTTGDQVDDPPVSTAGRIHFTTGDGRLFALDASGRELWKIALTENAFTSPPLSTDGTVIVGSRRGRLHAFDAATGKVRWEYDVGGGVQGSANRVTLSGGKKGVVVISQADGAIHCVDLAGGKRIWKTAEVDRCDGSASVGDGRIVMGSCASALHVFSVAKAKKTADIPLGADCQVAGGVALAGKVAFAGTRCGHVCAVDVAVGKILWTNRDSKRETFTTPAVNDRHVVFGSDDGKVYCLRRDSGTKIWAFDTDDTPSSPVIAADRVVVSSGGALILLDLETGRKVWSVRVSDWITSPAVISGMVIVGADDGTVTAFGRR
jgi:outer membrane protein assembly factor BamB